MKAFSLSVRKRALPISILFCVLVFCVSNAAAQGAQPGNNTVWKISTLGAVVKAPSTAFIDASVLSGSDLCAQIHTALGYISTGTSASRVIDARGISGAGLTCTSGTPWINGASSYNVAADILLPSGTITISAGWQLPGGTTLIGQGLRDVGTTIQWGGGTTPSYMVQFCVGTTPCNNVSVQGIVFNGGGSANTFSQGMIANALAGDSLSSVDHVNFGSFSGTGLYVSASGSGAYTNLSCDPQNTSSTCIELMASNTGGLHGVTCTVRAAGSTVPAISLDGSGNTVEDIHIEAFEYAIQVGVNATAQDNTLINVNGSDSNGMFSMTSVILVSNAFSATGDLTILDAGAAGSLVAHLLEDQISGGVIPNSTQTALAEYVIGDSFSAGLTTPGYPRFATTTSVNTGTGTQSIPTWGSGSAAVTLGAACPVVGAIYSNTSSTGGTLFVCLAGSGTNKGWQQII